MVNSTKSPSSRRARPGNRVLAISLPVLAVGLAVLVSPPGIVLPDDAAGSTTTRQGGVNIPSQAGGLSKAARFGHRVLRVGMAGRDVGVLQTMVGSGGNGQRATRSLLTPGSLYDDGTERAVKRFQKRSGMQPSGVVTRKTADLLKARMGRAGASWYGPGFYGNRTACGQRLRVSTVGVAHKTLPCGSKVLIGYRGRFLLTRVIDRGPFIAGRSWDLTNGARISLGYSGIDPVRYLVAGN